MNVTNGVKDACDAVDSNGIETVCNDRFNFLWQFMFMYASALVAVEYISCCIVNNLILDIDGTCDTIAGHGKVRCCVACNWSIDQCRGIEPRLCDCNHIIMYVHDTRVFIYESVISYQLFVLNIASCVCDLGNIPESLCC